MAVAIQAERLLRELDEVWVSLGKQQRESGGVLRACAMTLVVLVEDGPQPVDVAETLAELMHDHPARAIVVRVGGEGLSARSTAQCWMPFGRRQQICCELIEISAPGHALDEVPPVLRGLLAPDLPVVMWLRSAGLLQWPPIAEFLNLAQKVIVEPRGFEDSESLTAKLRQVSGAGISAADLAWTRITRWRETLARLFDDPATAASLGRVREIVVRHSSPAPGPAAAYLAAWIRLSLDRETPARFEMAASNRSWAIQEVTLNGEGDALSISRTERGFVDIRAGGIGSRAVFRQLRESDLLREELSILGPDPVFERVLRAV